MSYAQLSSTAIDKNEREIVVLGEACMRGEKGRVSELYLWTIKSCNCCYRVELGTNWHPNALFKYFFGCVGVRQCLGM